MSVNYITDKIKALIGTRTPTVVAHHPVEASEIRRYHQATLDPHPRYWDEEWAKRSRYGAIVAPPAFPVFAFRRAPTEDSPVDEHSADPDFDGIDHKPFRDLPEIDVPLKRIINGGYKYIFYRYARLGERMCRTSSYKDIYQRDGNSGAMIFVTVEDVYTTVAGERLLDVLGTSILR